MDKLKTIKITVAILTFLLVFGMLSSIGIIYKKVSRPQAPKTANITLNQPTDSRIGDYKVIDKSLYLLIKDGGLPDRLLILDLQNPQNQTLINLN